MKFDETNLPLPSWWAGKDEEEIAMLLVTHAAMRLEKKRGYQFTVRWLERVGSQVSSSLVAKAEIDRIMRAGK